MALLCMVSPSGISSFENVMTRVVNTLATIFSNLSNVIESTKDFWNMLRNLSLCCSDVSKRSKTETYVGVLDNCSTKNRWDFWIATSKISFSFFSYASLVYLCVSVLISSSTIFSLPSGCRYMTSLETLPDRVMKVVSSSSSSFESLGSATSPTRYPKGTLFSRYCILVGGRMLMTW